MLFGWFWVLRGLQIASLYRKSSSLSTACWLAIKMKNWKPETPGICQVLWANLHENRSKPPSIGDFIHSTTNPSSEAEQRGLRNLKSTAAKSDKPTCWFSCASPEELAGEGAEEAQILSKYLIDLLARLKANKSPPKPPENHQGKPREKDLNKYQAGDPLKRYVS